MAARKAWVRVINGEPVCLDAQLPVPKPLDGVHTAQTVAYIPESELSALRAEHEAVLKLLDWVGGGADGYSSDGRWRQFYRYVDDHDLAVEDEHGRLFEAKTAVELLAMLDGKAGGQ